jgi:hypothetical protein
VGRHALCLQIGENSLLFSGNKIALCRFKERGNESLKSSFVMISWFLESMGSPTLPRLGMYPDHQSPRGLQLVWRMAR